MVATGVVDHYRAEFEALERRRAARGPAWLPPLRRAAMARFAERGLPTTRDEDWRYTNLAALAAGSFRPAAGPPPPGLPAEMLERLRVGPSDWPCLVFVDGRFSPRHSSPGPLTGGGLASSLAAALLTDGALLEAHLRRPAAVDAGVFAALNTAFLEHGAFVGLPPEACPASPVELLFVTATPHVLAQPRVVIVAGAHSRLTVVERYVGLTGEAAFTNAVTEIVVGPGAEVDHHAVQEQGPETFHVATVHAALERDARFSTCGVILGGRLARTTLGLAFAGPGAQGVLRGLYVVGGRQHVDHHVSVDHAVPRCASRQLFKGVLDEQARAVFNGRILVRQDAQKTDADQTNKHLLLSDGAEVDSKPQLEIFADDVRCTHGAAEGQLAPEALFYLRSRGVSEPTARALLTYGFAREVIEGVAVEPVRAHLERALVARLDTGRRVSAGAAGSLPASVVGEDG